MFRGLPKTLAIGAGWIAATIGVLSWTGWLEPPTLAAARARDDQQRAELRAQAAENAIVLLKYQQEQTNEELRRVNGKLDEMAMVVYSMERRLR